MPGEVVRGCAGRSQDTLRRDRYGKDRRLGELGQAKLLFRPVKAEIRQVKAQGIIGFLKGLPRERKGGGQVASHADALRTLTGE